MCDIDIYLVALFIEQCKMCMLGVLARLCRDVVSALFDVREVYRVSWSLCLQNLYS